MSTPFIEIIPTARETPIEIPVEAPWVTALTFSITLRNWDTGVIIANDTFNDSTQSVPSSGGDKKWVLLDAETDQEVDVKEDFSPFRGFSRVESQRDVEIEPERNREGVLLLPGKPLQMTIFPFRPFVQRTDMTIGNSQSGRTYKLHPTRKDIPVYKTEAKSHLDLARLRREGRTLFSPSVSLFPIHMNTDTPLIFSTTTSTSPWIEAQISPSTSSFNLANPEDGLSLVLNLILHSSRDSITIPSGFTILESLTALSQAGGLISFINTETGVPVRRPKIYANRVKKKPSLFGNDHYTLTPEQSTIVNHELITKSPSIETVEEKVKFNGFHVGRKYSIVLDRRCSINKWLPVGTMQNLLSRVALSTEWSGEEIEWEEGCIPLVQRNVESFEIVGG